MPIRMLLLAIAGWLNEEQREKMEFLQEQIRVFQELHRGKPLRLNTISVDGWQPKGNGLAAACWENWSRS